MGGDPDIGVDADASYGRTRGAGGDGKVFQVSPVAYFDHAPASARAGSDPTGDRSVIELGEKRLSARQAS